MFYVYVLKCNNNDLYIGYSDNLKKRYQKHILGKVKSTKSKKPLSLVYYEAYKDKRDATGREKQLKMHRVKTDLKKQLKYSIKKNIIGPMAK